MSLKTAGQRAPKAVDSGRIGCQAVLEHEKLQ